MAGMSLTRLSSPAAACILSSYCAQELAAFLQSLAAHASSLFPSGRCRRRPHAGELDRVRKGPVLFGELHRPLIPAKDRASIAQFGSRPLALITALAAGLRRKSMTARPPSGAGEAL